MISTLRNSLRRYSPPAVAVTLVLVGIEKGCGGPGPRPAPPDDSARSPVRSTSLERASAHRRAGETDRALALYRAAATDSNARPNERAHARAWHARLRLARGELSSLDDLEALVHEHADPALLARIAGALGRFATQHGHESSTFGARAKRLRERCTECLEHKSRVFDEDGERAKRWLKHVAPLSR